MSIPTIPSLQKNNRKASLLLAFCFALLSVYPIYRNFYYSNGLLTYERHRAVIEKRSEFYNPWQYRVLCPYTIEGLLWVYNHTIDKIYPIEQKLHFSIESTSGTGAETDQFVKLLQTPGAMKYMILFIFFRFIEHFFIFYLVWGLWQYFIKSKWLVFFGVNFLALALGNAVTAADLSFNTYMDIIFYLLAAHIIVFKKNPNWLLLLTPLAAFNRETGLLMPALYFISQTDFTAFRLSKFNIRDIGFPGRATWLLTIVCYVLFLSIFIGLKWYFGYRPQQVWKAPAGLPMLKLNLFSAVGVKAWLELIGTFAVIPLVLLYRFKTYPYLLRKWFLFLVPLWFAVHFVSVVAYQTRLFMVPMVLVIMPMLLWRVEQETIRANPVPQQ
jgi:hypothetical protein